MLLCNAIVVQGCYERVSCQENNRARECNIRTLELPLEAALILDEADHLERKLELLRCLIKYPDWSRIITLSKEL